MTKFDFDGKMKKITLTISKNREFKFTMEGEMGVFKTEKIPLCKPNPAYHYNSQMIELNENLKSITYYFIKLFFKTNKKYSCTPTKLGKLISILAFKRAVKGERLFPEPIYKYPPLCGTLIKALTFIPKDIYFRDLDQPNPDKLFPIEDVFDDTVTIPNQYVEFGEPSDSLKAEITNVFREFGAYPADSLGKLLNPIVAKTVNSENNEIDLSLLENMNSNSFESDESTDKIIRYIYT